MPHRVQGLPIDRGISIASFLVGCVDAVVDLWIRNSGLDNALLWQVGMVNAKLAYQLFGELFRGPKYGSPGLMTSLGIDTT